MQEVLPGGKDQESGDCGGIVEELAAGAELLPGGAPEFVGDVADGVNGEGQQVQGRQDGGEVALAVTEIVLDVVSLGLENVEGLVLDLPAGATAGREFGDIIGAHRQVGNETVAIGDIAIEAREPLKTEFRTLVENQAVGVTLGESSAILILAFDGFCWGAAPWVSLGESG